MAQIKNFSLDDLIEAIAAAVITAQDRIEKHQIDNLQNYFKRDPENENLVRPLSFQIALPSMGDQPSTAEPDGDGPLEDIIVVPLITVIPQNQLRIKDVKITFDAEISHIEPSPYDEQDPADSSLQAENGQQSDDPRELVRKVTQKRRKMGVDVSSGLRNKAANTANVVLTVESGEPTEGAARVLHHLTKRI